MMIIDREELMDKLISLKGTRLIKVISGIRRSGKSFLLFNLFYGHLLRTGVDEGHILRYELDAMENERLRNRYALYDDVKSRITDNEQYYVLIDEIQLVDSFFEVLNSLLHKENVDVYVTGSNSRFLSSDIVTEFRGRSMEIRVRPLSFSEFAVAKGIDPRDCIEEYMDYGGMPELFKIDDPEQKTNYLKNLMSKVYISDIVERRNIRYSDELENITDLLCSSIGSLNNVVKITNTLRTVKKSKITDKTVKAYLDSLCDSFLFERAMRYDIKGRRYFDSQSKFYIADTGLKNARENFRQAERTHVMENIIYNELRSRGYDVDVGVVNITSTEGGVRKVIGVEVDFVANKGNERIYIQSAYHMTDESREREIRPFLKMNDSFKKVVITDDTVSRRMDDDGILTIGLIEFLMDRKSLQI